MEATRKQLWVWRYSTPRQRTTGTAETFARGSINTGVDICRTKVVARGFVDCGCNSCCSHLQVKAMVTEELGLLWGNKYIKPDGIRDLNLLWNLVFTQDVKTEFCDDCHHQMEANLILKLVGGCPFVCSSRAFLKVVWRQVNRTARMFKASSHLDSCSWPFMDIKYR